MCLLKWGRRSSGVVDLFLFVASIQTALLYLTYITQIIYGSPYVEQQSSCNMGHVIFLSPHHQFQRLRALTHGNMQKTYGNFRIQFSL